MGIAKDALGQQFGMLADLRQRIQASTRVIQIDVPLGVEASVLGRAEPIHGSGVLVLGIGPDELRMRGELGGNGRRRRAGTHPPIMNGDEVCLEPTARLTCSAPWDLLVR